MSQIFKVTVDQSISGKVVGIEDFSGSYGPSYHVDLEVGAEVFRVTEGKERVDRALQDRSLSRDTVIGRTVKFWKRPMADDPKKGYLNIDLLDTARSVPSAPTPPTPPAPTQKPKESVPAWLEPEVKELRIKQQAEDDLTWCWNKAWSILEPKIVGSNGLMADPMTLQAIQAAAVSLMIRLEHARR